MRNGYGLENYAGPETRRHGWCLTKQGAAAVTAGEIITTGVMTDAHPVRAGERWSTQVSGAALAGLTIEFT